jgi:hypothetical protein
VGLLPGITRSVGVPWVEREGPLDDVDDVAVLGDRCTRALPGQSPSSATPLVPARRLRNNGSRVWTRLCLFGRGEQSVGFAETNTNGSAGKLKGDWFRPSTDMRPFLFSLLILCFTFFLF